MIPPVLRRGVSVWLAAFLGALAVAAGALVGFSVFGPSKSSSPPEPPALRPQAGQAPVPVQPNRPAGPFETVAGPGLCGRSVVPPTVEPGSGALVFSGRKGGGRGVWLAARDLARGPVVTGPSGTVADVPPPDAGRAESGSLAIAAGGLVQAQGSRLVVVSELESGSGMRSMGLAADHPEPNELGDGGPVSAARFRSIRLVAGDETGNLYVADEMAPGGPVRIRFLNLGRESVSVFAGSAKAVAVGSGSIDTIAVLRGEAEALQAEGPSGVPVLAGSPTAMAVGGGRLYLSTVERGAAGAPRLAVGVVNLAGQAVVAHGLTAAPGEAVTLVEPARPGLSGDGGPAEAAQLGSVSALAVDRRGNLFLADPEGHRVRRVDHAGFVSTFAGTGKAPGNDWPDHDVLATEEAFDRPADVGVGPLGEVFVFDEGRAEVRSVGLDGFSRHHRYLYSVTGCLESEAAAPSAAPPGATPAGGGLSVAAVGGSTYVAGPSVDGVMRLRPPAHPVEILDNLVAPRLCPVKGCPPVPGGPPVAGSSPPARPIALASSGAHDALYMFDAEKAIVRVANVGGHPLRVHGVEVRPGAVVTVAGLGVATGDGSSAAARTPTGGTAAPDDEGNARSAQLTVPDPARVGQPLAADDKGNLFIADGDQVRVVDDKGSISTLIAPGQEGIGRPRTVTLGPSGSLVVGDDIRVWLFNRGRSTLRLYGATVPPGALRPIPASNQPLQAAAMAVDGDGNLFVSSLYERAVRRLVPETNTSIVVGADTDPRLDSPTGLAIDRHGDLLITDAGTERLMRLSLTRRPASASASAGGDRYLGTSPTFRWILAGLALALAVGALALFLTGRSSAARSRRVRLAGVAAALAVLAGGLVLVANAGTRGGNTRIAPATGPWAWPPSVASASAIGEASSKAPPASLSIERGFHTATLLDPPLCRRSSPPAGYPCGQVLVVGGIDVSGGAALPTGEVELYDPAAARWRHTAAVPVRRFAHTATLLADGRVLVVGGENADGTGIADAELYDPVQGAWTPTGSAMTKGRFGHTATRLDGPACRAASDKRPKWCGRVLVTGGSSSKGRGDIASIELYDPATDTWSTGPPLSFPRQNHTAAALPDGRVLIAGGLHERAAVSSTEVYEPATGYKLPAGSLSVARAFHRATILDAPECHASRPPPWCARMMVTGGLVEGGVEEGFQDGKSTATAEVFDPSAVRGGVKGQWYPVRLMGTSRQGHTATLLFDGKLYVTGGDENGTSESYDAATGTWRPAPGMAPGRINFTTTLLDGPLCRSRQPRPWCGSALVAGGITHEADSLFTGWTSLNSVSIYKPPAG